MNLRRSSESPASTGIAAREEEAGRSVAPDRPSAADREPRTVDAPGVDVPGAGRARWLALGALGLAMLTIGLDTTVLVVALPTMALDLHANTAALQWFTTAYTLALAAVMLPAGALGDRYGRKKFLLAA